MWRYWRKCMNKILKKKKKNWGYFDLNLTFHAAEWEVKRWPKIFSHGNMIIDIDSKMLRCGTSMPFVAAMLRKIIIMYNKYESITEFIHHDVWLYLLVIGNASDFRKCYLNYWSKIKYNHLQLLSREMGYGYWMINIHIWETTHRRLPTASCNLWWGRFAFD